MIWRARPDNLAVLSRWKFSSDGSATNKAPFWANLFTPCSGHPSFLTATNSWSGCWGVLENIPAVIRQEAWLCSAQRTHTHHSLTRSHHPQSALCPCVWGRTCWFFSLRGNWAVWLRYHILGTSKDKDANSKVKIMIAFKGSGFKGWFL